MFCLKSVRAGLFSILTLLLVLLAHEAPAAQNQPSAVLIIDGSGSMWGRIGGREKIIVVREQLADKIELLKGKVDLGIMSYGHRRRRDCRDVQMIVPISPIDMAIHSKKIKRLLPRGKTPVTSALRRAAKALASSQETKTKNQKSHIILVADGTENCRQDPCQTAQDLKEKYPDLTIDVIGFAVRNKDIAQLQCIARNSKGRFHKADNAQQLKQSIEQIFANLGQSSTPPIIRKKQTPTTPPGLYLTAGLAKRGAPLDQNVTWRIYRAGESAKTNATPLKRVAKAQPVLQLPTGKYHIEVRHFGLFAEQNIELRPRQANKIHLSFNRGILTASARLSKSASLSNDVIFSLYDASQGPVGPGNIIVHKQKKNPVFYLRPGKYSLKARVSETQAQHDFTLKAGERKRHTLLLNAGQIKLEARLAKDGPALADVQYAIYQRGEKADMEFVRTLDPTPSLILPAGNYFVVAKQGAASNTARLQVTAGEKKNLLLILNAGILKLSSNQGQGTKDRPAQIAYTIKAIKPTSPKTIKLSTDGKLVEQEQSLPTRSFRSSFVLPQGDYIVNALVGNSNAQASARVHIEAGQESLNKIALSAGRIKLSLVISAGDPPLAGVYWSILDATGKLVASASTMAPSVTLVKGHYQARADYLDKSIQRNFSIKSGDNKKLQLIIQ